MKTRFFPQMALGIFTGLALAAPTPSRADYEQRISIGAGFAIVGNPSQTAFELGLEYEYRLDAFIGLGFSGNYVFTDPGIGLIAVPDLFVHPFATELLLSAAPLVRIESGANAVGVRLGTRIPLPLGPIALVPTFAVDVISGGPDYLIGLGLEF